MNSFYQLNTTEEAIPYVLFYDNGNSVVPSHWHKEVELIYSLQGDTQMMINDRVFDLHEGDIGIAVGGDIHFNLCSQNHRRAVIMFNLDMFEDANSHGRIKSEIKKQLETMARISTGWPPKVRDKVVNIVEKLRVLNETGRLRPYLGDQSTDDRPHPHPLQRGSQKQQPVQYVHQHQSDEND